MSAFPQLPTGPLQVDSSVTPGAEALERTGAFFDSLLGMGPPVQRKLLLSVAAVFGVWLLRRVVVRIVSSQLDEPRARYAWVKSTAYVAYVLGFLLLGQIWLESVRNVGTFLGLLTAGLAIALKDLVSNVAGWAFILMRHPFKVGDRIQIGEHRGDVVDIRLFQFTLLEVGNWVHADQSTGRIIHVPNSSVFSQPQANYTDEFAYVWHELEVLVTFESDWRRAKERFQEILDEIARDVAAQAANELRRGSRKFLISYRHFSPKVYTSVLDSGVLLTLRFLAPVRARRGMAETLWEAILDALHEESGIDLAYPTRRMYWNPVEGKHDARAPWPPPASAVQPGDE
jgi:small-conductance mechanosensitive channel